MDLLWMDLLNSIWRDWRGTGRPVEDRIHQKKWQSAFLEKWGLDAEVPALDAELHELMELRTFLQEVTEKITAGGKWEQKDIDYLNTYLKRAPVIRKLEESEQALQVALISTQTSWKKVLESIVTSFIQTIIDGQADRIKICDNKECLWVYFDSTRNHSKKYCDDKTCGNLLKVRKFRERKRNKQ